MNCRLIRCGLIALLLVCGVYAAAMNASGVIRNKANSVDAYRWADSVIATLSTKEKVAQITVPHLVIKDDAAGLALLRKMVGELKVGGILLGKGTVSSYKHLIEEAKKLSGTPLLVTLDGEWGPSMRLSDIPRFPYNMAIGATSDIDIISRYGEEVARECRELGINVNFAPVADVNSNPLNPVISYRSFGQNPRRVSNAVNAFSKGLEEGGVMAVAKHFPGHGDTSADSHKTLPVVTHSEDKLWNTDLVPFIDYINNGYSGVMVAHLNVPALDSSYTPSSLSNKITTGLLRNRLDFDGLIFTDALAMKGAAGGENNAFLALKAGADILLGPLNPEREITSVVNSIKQGKLDISVLNNACHRVLRYKYALDNCMPSAKPQLNNKSASDLRKALAEKSIVTLVNKNGIIPLDHTADNIHNVVIDAKEYQTRQFPANDIVMAVIKSSDASAVKRLETLADRNRTVAVFLLNPYKLSKFKNVYHKLDGAILACDNTPELHDAALDAVFGKFVPSGTLPVDIDGIGKEGDGIFNCKNTAISDEIDSIVNNAINQGAIPGAQVYISYKDNVLLNKPYGFTVIDKTNKVSNSTIYDLASVTKAIGTTLGLMKAYDEGLFKLDDPIGKYVEAMDSTDKRNIRFRDLLFHQSGLPAGISVKWVELSGKRCDEEDLIVAKGLYTDYSTADSLLKKIGAVKLKSKQYRYSDLNFVLLKEALESMTGVEFSQWLDTEIFMPAGLDKICFCPAEERPELEVAPTENDTEFRHQMLKGYVHDEISAICGGVQGNAGLFSNASDVAALCRMLLNEGEINGKRIINRETVRLFTTVANRSSNRYLGFDKQPSDSPAPSSVFGHNGFTGTCFWVDPLNDIIIVFLSNRVHPTRKNSAFNTLKPRTAIIESVYKHLSEGRLK